MRKLLFISFICLLLACSKEELSVFIDTQISGTSNELNAVYFTDENTGYALGGSRYLESTLLKTVDAGENWLEIDIEELDKIFYDISFYPSGDAIAAAYNSKIVYYDSSEDSWTFRQLQTLPLWYPVRSVSVKEDVSLLAGGNGLRSGFISRSVDGGNNWEHTPYDFEFRSLAWKNEQEVFVCGFGVLMKSDDAGLTWNHIDIQGDLFTDMTFTSEQVGYITGHQGSILKTTDGGESWEKLRNASSLIQTRRRFESLYFFDDVHGILVGEKGLFWRTVDGGENWMEADLGTESHLQSVYCIDSETCFLVGTDGLIMRVGI